MMTGWSLDWALLPDDALSVVDWDSLTVTLDVRMPAPHMRCTLAHTLARIELGPGCSESEVADRAARQLIGIEALAAAWSDDRQELAARLFVDERTLAARLHGLTDGEREQCLTASPMSYAERLWDEFQSGSHHATTGGTHHH